MAQVTGMTAEEIEEELSTTIVSGSIDPVTSRLLLRTKAGAVMDVGPVGGSSSNAYVHVQDAAAATWTIVHNLGFYPNVTIVDSAGSEVMGDISYPDINTVTASFGGAFGGRAYLS